MPTIYWIDYIGLCMMAIIPVTITFIPIRILITKVLAPTYFEDIFDTILSILISIMSGLLTWCILYYVMHMLLILGEL